MEKITICIIDKDDSYKEALTGFMKSYCMNYIISSPGIDDLDEKGFVSIVDHNNIILINYDYLEYIKNMIGARLIEFEKKAIVLLENFARCDEKHTKGFNVVSKYADIKKLISYINNHFYKIDSNWEKSEGTLTALILCIGLSGGSGVSSISSAIASELSKYDSKRVFYLSMDMFESEIEAANGSEHEQLYYSLIKKGFTNEENIIKNSVIENKNGFFRMPVSKNKNAFMELATNEKKQYLESIIGGYKFDYVIVDAGNQMDEFTDHLIINSQQIILIDKHSSNKGCYMRYLLDYIRNTKTTKKKTMIIENFVMGETQTYEDAIAISQCDVAGNESVEDCIKFSTEIKNTINYLS